MKKQIYALVIFLVIILIIPFPAYAAETRKVIGGVVISPDTDNMTINMTWNLTDPSNMYLLNWNQTVQPWINETGINGSFTGTFLPPIEVLIGTGMQHLTLSGIVKFKSSWIMSGSSESYWRVPVIVDYDARVHLKLWRIGSPDMVNTTADGSPIDICHPFKIFDYNFTLTNTYLNNTYHWFNTTAWNRSFNSTWVRVRAPIHADETYMARWYIRNNTVDAHMYARFSQTDIAEDLDYRTWVIGTGLREEYEADLDFSVLHTLGLGYCVYGNEIEKKKITLYYLDFEDEDGTSLEDYSDDITVTTGGSSYAEINSSFSPVGNTSGMIYYDGGTECKVRIYNDEVNGQFSLSFIFQVSVLSANFWVEWFDGGNMIIQWIIDSTGFINIKYGNGAGGSNIVYAPYSANEEISIQLDFDLDIDKYRSFVNGVLYEGPNANENGYDNFLNDMTATKIDQMSIGDNAGSAYFWIDELEIFYYPPQYIFWDIELSEPVENGDYLTVQMPFFDVVTNESQVRVQIQTQNVSWSDGNWVAFNGPTDFFLESFLWSESYPATEFEIIVTIYNKSRTLWCMDRNTQGHPEITWQYNHFTVTNHIWAPDDYNFGGVPYCIVQITNGSWVNDKVPVLYIFGERFVRWEDVRENPSYSDRWVLLMIVKGWVGLQRVTAAISYAFRGDWENASLALDPDAPFPWDAPWYIGKWWGSASGFLSKLGKAIWQAGVWLYQALQWVVKNGPWIVAGIIYVLTLFLIILIWPRFFMLLGGLVRFGWILARDGFVAAVEFAYEFWVNYIRTSLIKKVATRVARKG